MVWAWISLGTYVLFAALAFGLRMWVQHRRTGSSGFRVTKARGNERLAGLLVSVTMMLWLMTPIAAVFAWTPFILALDRDALHIAGLAIGALGIVATVFSQFAMGESWRVGIDSTERTMLVTRGPFRWVRNPIYSSLLLFAAGNLLVTPTWLAFLSFVLMVISIEVQVRWVEEPYLLGFHGDAYRAWATRTGRFIPGFGRMS